MSKWVSKFNNNEVLRMVHDSYHSEEGAQPHEIVAIGGLVGLWVVTLSITFYALGDISGIGAFLLAFFLSEVVVFFSVVLTSSRRGAVQVWCFWATIIASYWVANAAMWIMYWGQRWI